MLYDDFIKKYINKKIDFDGQYNCQCVDLFNQYCIDVLNIKIEYFPQYAKNFWTERKKIKWIKDNFNIINIDFDNPNLKKGDVGIRTSGYAGHIFIIDCVNDYTITYYDTNGSGKHDKMTKRIKPFNNVFISGVLRPKNQININSDKSNKILFNIGKNYKLLYNMNVRKKAGLNSPIKKKKELTIDGQKHCVKGLYNGVLKKSTIVTVLEINRKIKGQIWLRIPSGWICGYKDNKIYLIEVK